MTYSWAGIINIAKMSILSKISYKVNEIKFCWNLLNSENYKEQSDNISVQVSSVTQLGMLWRPHFSGHWNLVDTWKNPLTQHE